MGKGSAIAPIALLALAAGGVYYAQKHGLFRGGFVADQVRTSEAQMKLRLTGFHGTNDGNVYADIEALNPSSFPLQVKSIIGDILVKGRKVGAVKMFGDQVIRPADQAVLPVSVRVLPAAVVLFRKKGTPVSFRGQINLNNIVRPLEMDYTI